MARESNTPLDYARKLRKDMTDAERALWRLLRDRRMDGWRFRRQEQIDRFIVDFVCFKARLIIEVDGGQHYESESDRTRILIYSRRDFACCGSGTPMFLPTGTASIRSS